jgi:hypothetical protein
MFILSKKAPDTCWILSWTTRVQLPVGAGISLSVAAFKPVLGISEPALSDLHLVPRLRIRGALPPLPIHLYGMLLKYRDNCNFVVFITLNKYEGVSKSFQTGCLEQELQMIQLYATRCSCIAIL